MLTMFESTFGDSTKLFIIQSIIKILEHLLPSVKIIDWLKIASLKFPFVADPESVDGALACQHVGLL